MVAQFEETKKLGTILEYRLVWNPEYFRRGNRILNEHHITGVEFVKFMMVSANIMTL